MSDDDLDQLIARLDLPTKVRLLTGADFWSLPSEPAIGLRAIVTSDGPIGVRGARWDETDYALTLPCPTALAATWDEQLVRRAAGLLAGEARRKGVDVLLAPTLNLQRSPFAGRHFEYFAEDPLLVARIGAAYIQGVQAGGVAATAKHYVANDSETDRLTLDAHIDERSLREIYLQPFEAAVRAGVCAVMSAFNAVNGTPMSEHPLLRDPLKGEWGFDGPVVSDWGAVRSTVASGNAAQDWVMPGPDGPWSAALVEAVSDGRVAEATIDDKVRRLLRLAVRVGALNGAPTRGISNANPTQLLRQIVAVSSVLLRNEDDVLPLNPAQLRRIAVIGPRANRLLPQGGGASAVYPPRVVQILDSLRAALPDDVVIVHRPGATDGGPGTPVTGPVIARYLDTDGAELVRETRQTGRILEPIVALDDRDVAVVEMRARVDLEYSGEWTVGVAGVGHLTLSVDGAIVVDDVTTLDTEDPATADAIPPLRSATLRADTTRVVELVARREVSRETGTALTLTLDASYDAAAARADAVAAARGSDVAIVVVGTTEQLESEGVDRTTLALPGDQDDLVRVVAAANPRTVVVVNSGSPVLLPWRDEVAGILLAWLPGQEGGHGITDVLLGRAEPGGRLPTTWPASGKDEPLPVTTPVDGVLQYSEGLHVGYRGWLRAGVAPAYWFGHGLGYTKWQYEQIEAPRTVGGEHLEVRVRIRNVGRRRGREVVQVYLARPSSTIDRPVRWLAGYHAVEAEPGELANITVHVPPSALRHWSAMDAAWRIESGPIDVLAGPHAGDLPLRTTTVVRD